MIAYNIYVHIKHILFEELKLSMLTENFLPKHTLKR